jgi:hypothetical protein
MSSTQDWIYRNVVALFPRHGCSVASCSYHFPPDCSSQPGTFCCALNVSDALIRAGYTLPAAISVNYCNHTSSAANGTNRVRNADGMSRICRQQNGGVIDVSGWASRPSWKGIVYFEGGPDLGGATGHIDFWDGASAVHTQYPTAATVWFWRLG